MSTNVSTLESGRPKTNPFLRALLGLLLLLPACGLCSFNLFILSMNTFAGSLRSSSLAGSGEFIGMENYTRMFGSPRFSSLFGYTFLLIIIHVLMGSIFPLLITFLVSTFGEKLRLGVRLFFTLPLAFFGPALMMYGPGYMRSLWNLEFPERTYLLFDGLAGLAVACGVGLIIYSAVLRGQKDSEAGWKQIQKPLIITWLVAQLATTAYVIQSFNSLSGLLPARGSVSPGNFLFQTIRVAQGGSTFAFSTLTLFVVTLLGIAATLLIVLGRVQLKLEPQNETTVPPATRSIFTTLGWVALVIGGVAIFLVSVLPWFIALFKSVTALGDGLSGVSIFRVWMNSLLPPLVVILFIQLPVAYLGALGIGVARPFGKWSQWILLLFSPWLFVTSLPLGFAAFNNLREVELLNTIVALTPPILLSVPMLFILTLFFIGQEPKWQEARAEGTSAMNALFKQLIVPSLPLAGLLAAFSLLAATQELFTPLMAGISPDQLTATTAILKISATFGSSGTSALIIILFGLPLFLIFFAIFAALQVFYLNHLTLTRETVAISQAKEEPEPTNP